MSQQAEQSSGTRPRPLHHRPIDAQETLQRFAKRASHDLHQPLAAVRLLLQQTPHLTSDAERTETLEIALESLDLLHNQLASLVTAARLAAGLEQHHANTVDLPHLAKTLVDEITPQLNADVAVVTECEPVRLTADATLLHSLLSHLLKNAVENTTRGQITLSAMASNGAIDFKIEDTGQGIHPGCFEHLGTPFWQNDSETKSYTKGLGLGLYTAVQTAALLNTTLEINSQTGVGTAISFRLPQT